MPPVSQTPAENDPNAIPPAEVPPADVPPPDSPQPGAGPIEPASAPTGQPELKPGEGLQPAIWIAVGIALLVCVIALTRNGEPEKPAPGEGAAGNAPASVEVE